MTTNPHLVITPEIGLATVAELAAQLRVDSIRSSAVAGSGHPTSSMSAADLLAALVSRQPRYDWPTVILARTVKGGGFSEVEDSPDLGADGPSQMAQEDIAMLRAVHQSTVLDPVREPPGSGSGAGLPAWAAIDADHTAVAARNLVGARRHAVPDGPEES
ncbi:hypothetical protein EV644_10127 [Kribbella orskensis]|uniref:Thiamine pyrophosphate-dependent enzyme n=1 Tax=Kribbella orskensis TaxID=2512216 RepID=A0ABY2BT02_9ACTN|nr:MULTISPECIES: hypothetical protein [Kribbella]TCN44835.1 hypothetical protein EV642_101962 [Kribbella sp. VKM Ac-2500]TCO31387.1 hypothetical protein EV644_10127 [Kribbella orskensis]